MTKGSSRNPGLVATDPPDTTKEEHGAARKRGASARSGWKEVAVLGLIIVMFSILNVNWILRDQGVLLWDGSFYLSKLLLFLDELGPDTFKSFEASMRQLSLGGRPPLYQIVTIPFIFLFGRSEDAALSINVIFIVILLISVYNIGILSKNRKAGLLAVFIVVCYPPVIHLSRMYVPYFAVVSLGALSVWLLIVLLERPSVRISLYLTASLALGLLTHPYFADVLIVPTAVFGIYLVFFRSRPFFPSALGGSKDWLWAKLRIPFVLYGLVPGSLVFVGVAAAWYLFLGNRLLSQRLQRLSDEASALRGADTLKCGFQNVDSDFWWYAVTAPSTLNLLFAVLAVCGLVWSLLRPRLATSILIVALLGGYIVKVTTVYSRCWAYFAPLLPAAAVLTAVFVVSIRPKWLSRLLASTCLIVAFFNYSVVTWGVQAWSRPIATAMGAPLDSSNCRNPAMSLALCPSLPRPGDVLSHKVLELIWKDPNCINTKAGGCRIMIGSPDLAAGIRYLNTFKGETKLWISGLGRKEYGQPFGLVALFRSDYIYYATWKVRLNREHYGASWVRFLQAPPPAFAAAHQTIASFDYGDGRSVKLIKRIKKVTVEEAESGIEALELREKYKSEKFLVLAPLFLAEGASDKALKYYEGAVRESLDSQFWVGFVLKIADLYRDRGNTERAIAIYGTILQRDPRNTDARIGLAESYQADNRFEEAVAELEAVIALRPKAVKPRLKLASLYRALGRKNLAVRLYEEVLTIDPNDVRARDDLDRMKLDR